jgi:cardiolipin synthase A/B
MTPPPDPSTRVPTRGRPTVQRAIDRSAAARPIPGNRVTILQDGPEAYQAMLGLIASAEHFLHFENYIFRSDATGWRFAEALAERARAGVAVRVLYDWLGCVGTRRRLWRFLRAAGCEVRAFNGPQLLRPFRLLSRDHRKLVVADSRRAVVGGLCIGNEWAGDPERGVPPWRDTAVLIDGPASHALDQAFRGLWNLTGEPLPEAETVAEVPSAGDADVRVVVGVPGRERAYRVLEYLAAGCRRRLWIVDAYLVPPPRLFEVLALAVRDGVDIRLLLPGASDVPLIRNLTRLGYRDMLRAGMRIFEWTGPMIHAKTMVADGRWVRVGTSNLNASSLIGNYELDVVIEDPLLARGMEAQFRRDVAASVEVVREARNAPAALSRVIPSRLAQRVGRRTAPPRRGTREFRARSMVAARRLASGAFRSLFGPLSVTLVVLGLISIGLPTVMGYIFGVLSLWFAVAAGLQAWRRRSPEP